MGGDELERFSGAKGRVPKIMEFNEGADNKALCHQKIDPSPMSGSGWRWKIGASDGDDSCKWMNRDLGNVLFFLGDGVAGDGVMIV